MKENIDIMWKTEYGSYIWKMNRPDSDHDYSVVYIENSFDYLTSSTKKGLSMSLSKAENYDYKEIGHFVDLIIRGNIMSIISLMSPIIIEDNYGALEELRNIYSNNLSKNFAKSIIGMSENNLKDYSIESLMKIKENGIIIERDRTDAEKIYDKKLKSIARVLIMGMHLLETGNFEFQPCQSVSNEEIRHLIRYFKKAESESKFPETINPMPFKQYIKKWRIFKMKKDGII